MYSDECVTRHLCELIIVRPESPYFKDSWMGCAIFEEWKFTKLCMEMPSLKDF
jgi:hypothetical protein